MSHSNPTEKDWDKTPTARKPRHCAKYRHSTEEFDTQVSWAQYERTLYDMYFEVANLRLGWSSDKVID